MSVDHETHLGADARSIIDAARSAEDPSGDDVARIRGKIFGHLGLAVAGGAAATLTATTAAEGAVSAATVAVGSEAAAGAAATTGIAAAPVTAASLTAAPVTAAATTTALGAGATTTVAAAGATSVGLVAKMTMATKIGLAVLALGGAGTGIVVATRTPEPAPTAVDAPAPAASADHLAIPSPARTAAPAAPESPSSPAAVVPSAPDPVASAATPDREPRPAGSAATPGPDVDPLAEEAALLGRAQSALAAGRHAEALAVLDEHARRFPSGVLAHEREAARWLALCGSGRGDAARGPVSAFLAEHPGSPLAARLRAACGLP